jgi:K+-sensing histidine kinase KdpD
MECHSSFRGVCARRSGSARQTTVEGSRIPREEQELIFDRFYQGGQIAVVKGSGLGSAFWVTMPAASGPVRKVGDTQEVAP